MSHNHIIKTKFPTDELQNLKLWIENRSKGEYEYEKEDKNKNLPQEEKVKEPYGYAALDTLLVFDYLQELEERLSLYHFALLCGGNCADDRRWKKINLYESYGKKLEKIAAEKKAEEKAKATVTPTSSLYEEDTKKVPDLYQGNPSSHMMETQDISTVKGEYLSLYQHRYEQLKSNYQAAPLPTSNDEIVAYTNAQTMAINQLEYLCPMEIGRKQVLLSVDLEHASDEYLTKQFSSLLQSIRAQVGVPEPSQAHKPHNKLLTVKKLLAYKAIQYLDLKLYCIINSPPGEEWQLSDDFMIKWLLADNEHMNTKKTRENPKGPENFKQYRKDFYCPKLLNQTYIDELISNTRSDPNNAQLRMHRL